MRLFWELSLRSFQRQIAYRAAALAGLATNFFFGILRASVLVALYGLKQQVEGMTIKDAVTYTGLTQGLIGFISLFSWYELMNSVYSGSVASDLLKPMDYYFYWLAQDFGRAIAQLLMRGLPMMAAYAIFFGISLPQDILQWMAFVAAMLLAWLVSFSWRFITNLASFWVPNAVGYIRFAFMVCWFTSGFLMPIRFYPPWFQNLCNLTPFPYTINALVEVYLGLVRGYDLLHLLLVQAAWIFILIAIGQLILRAGIRRLVILGG